MFYHQNFRKTRPYEIAKSGNFKLGRLDRKISTWFQKETQHRHSLTYNSIAISQRMAEKQVFYVSIDGNNSFVHSSSVGTVQCSILGPILYAIFVSPLFDLSKLTLFADKNYVIRWNRNLSELIVNMQAMIELITKWLRQSGLKVNDSKTEICLFFRKDHPPVTLNICNVEIKTKKQMNVLGVIFDSKLQWNNQVQNSIQKSKRALGAINIIKKISVKNNC